MSPGKPVGIPSGIMGILSVMFYHGNNIANEVFRPD